MQKSVDNEDLYVVWADGTYCALDEFNPSEWGHKSDDYLISSPVRYEFDEPIFVVSGV